MKIVCANINDPHFYELQQVVLNQDTTHRAFQLNGNYPMHLRMDGTKSQFFAEAERLFSREYALALKALLFNPFRNTDRLELTEPKSLLLSSGTLMNTGKIGIPEYMLIGAHYSNQPMGEYLTKLLELLGGKEKVGNKITPGGQQLITEMNIAIKKLMAAQFKEVPLTSNLVVGVNKAGEFFYHYDLMRQFDRARRRRAYNRVQNRVKLAEQRNKDYGEGQLELFATSYTPRQYYDSEQNNAAVDWLTETYPELNLKLRPMAQWQNATWAKDFRTILINSQKGDLTEAYHEAFHGISLGATTYEQREALYKETRNRLGKTVVRVGVAGKVVDIAGEDMDNAQTEEYLAQQFRLYMINGVNYKFPPKKAEEMKSFFQKLVDVFRSLFGFQMGSTDPMTMEDFFLTVREGRIPAKNIGAFDLSDFQGRTPSSSVLGMTEIDSLHFIKKFNIDFFKHIFSGSEIGNEVLTGLIEGRSVVLDKLYKEMFKEYLEVKGIDRIQVRAAHAEYLRKAYFIDISAPEYTQVQSEDGIELDSQSEEARSDTSLQFGNRMESSTIKASPKVIKLLFAGIQKQEGSDRFNPQLESAPTEEESFKTLFVQFAAAVYGTRTFSELQQVIDELATNLPAFKVVKERLQMWQNSTNPVLKSAYPQSVTFANKNFNRFISTNDEGLVVEALMNVQRVNETRKWKNHFLTKSSFGGVKFVINGNLKIDSFRTALEGTLRSNAYITPKIFYDLTGIELVPIGSNMDSMTQQRASARMSHILRTFLDTISKMQLVGDVPASRFLNERDIYHIYTDAFETKVNLLNLEVINDDLGVRKLLDPSKKLYAINDMTGLTVLTSKFKKFFSQINDDYDRVDNFHTLLYELGYVTEESTPENFVLQPFMKSSVILNRMIEIVKDWTFSLKDNIPTIDERIYIGQQQQIGTVSAEFDSMTAPEIARQQIKLLLSGHILTPRAGERSRESTLLMKSNKVAYLGLTSDSDFLDDHLLSGGVRGIKTMFLSSIRGKIRDEMRRIIALSVMPDDMLPEALQTGRNKDKYTIMDKYLAEYVPINRNQFGQPLKLVYRYNEDKSYRIDPMFIIPEDIKNQYAAAVASGTPLDQAMEDALDVFMNKINTSLHARLEEIYNVELNDFLTHLKSLNLIEVDRDSGYVDFLLDIDSGYITRLFEFESADETANSFGLVQNEAEHLLAFIFTKYKLSLIESLTFTVGNISSFAKFAEMARRLETLGSPIKQTPEGMPTLQRFDSRSEENKDNFMFYVFDDIDTKNNTTNDSVTFITDLGHRNRSKVRKGFREKYDEKIAFIRKGFEDGAEATDAQFRATLDYYRSATSNQTRWTEEMEDWYWAQTALILAKGLDYNREPGRTKLTFRGQEINVTNVNAWLAEHGYGIVRRSTTYVPTKNGEPMPLLSMKFRPKPLKPKGSGLKNQLPTGYSSYFMLKTSAAPIMAHHLHNDYMVELYFDMLNKGLDGYGFKSSFKASVPVIDEFGKAATRINSVNSSGIGIQLEEQGKESKTVVFSKQLMANSFADVSKNPYLSDNNRKDLLLQSKRRTELIRALEEVNAFEEFQRMGIHIDLANDTYKIFDKAKLAASITNRSSASLIDDDAKKVIERLLEQDGYFEYSNASSLVQSLFLSTFRSNIIDVKVPGMMAIQESDVSVNRELLFWRYENGELKEPQVRIPMPSMYFGWLRENFKENDTETDIEIFDNFRAAYSDPSHPKYDLIPAEMRKTLMNRTPLDARHSVTPVEVIEYFAPWESYSAEIPSHLVIPYGFDFDYDKLTFYMYKPTFSGGTKGLSYDFVPEGQTFAQELSELINDPAQFIKKAEMVIQIVAMNEGNINPSLDSKVQKLTDLLDTYGERKKRYIDADKSSRMILKEYDRRLSTIAGRIRKARQVKTLIQQGQEVPTRLSKYQGILSQLYAEQEAILRGDDVSDEVHSLVTAQLFPAKFREMMEELNREFIKDLLPLLLSVVKDKSINIPTEIFYNKKAISNSLVKTIRDSYMNEEMLYLTLSPTQTGNIKRIATDMLDENTNPDMPRWHSVIDPINNMRNSAIMLSGGKAIGIFASGIWVYSMLQQPDVNISINMDIGMIFEGFDIKKPIELGNQILDTNLEMSSDGLSEFISAALDLSKTLAPFYAGFNEVTAPMMMMLAISSNEGTFNMDYERIQRFFGATPVKYLFREAKTLNDRHGYGMYRALRNAKEEVLTNIEREMLDVIDQLNMQVSAKDSLRGIIYDEKASVLNVNNWDVADEFYKQTNSKKKGYQIKNKRPIKASSERVGISNATIDYMSKPLEEIIIDTLTANPKLDNFRNVIQQYFNKSLRMIQGAKIVYTQSLEFGDLTKNYRDSSARFFGYDSLLWRLSRKREIESGNTFLQGIESYNNNTFINVYRSAIDSAFKMLHSRSVFSQLFNDATNEGRGGIKAITKFLPFGSTITYTELESFFKAYTVLSGKSGYTDQDGNSKANWELVEDYLSVNPEFLPMNISEMYEDLKQTIAADEQLTLMFGPTNPLWGYLFAYPSFYDAFSKLTNPNMVQLGVTSPVLDDPMMDAIKATINSMRNDGKIGDKTQDFLNALALVNFSVNPNNTYNGITKITTMESFMLLQDNIDRIVSGENSILTSLEERNRFVTNYVDSIVYNNANDPRIVRPFMNPYGMRLDEYERELMAVTTEWEGFSSGIPKEMYAIDAFPDQYGSFPPYMSVKLPVIEAEINDPSVRPTFVSVVYKLVDLPEGDQVYRFKGASGYSKQLFIPSTEGNLNHKLTPSLEQKELSKNIRIVGTRMERVATLGRAGKSLKQSAKFPRIYLSAEEYRAFRQMQQQGQRGEMIITMRDSVQEVLNAQIGGKKQSIVFSRENETMNSVVLLTGISSFNSVDEFAKLAIGLEEGYDPNILNEYLTPEQLDALQNGTGLAVLNYKYTSTKFRGPLTSMDIADPVSGIDPVAQQKIYDFFDSIGFTRTEVDRIVTDSGTGARAVVDVAGHTVTHIAEGKLDIADMPEEAAHVYMEMLGNDSSLINEMLSEIREYYTYDEVMEDREQYPSHYTEDMLAREAVAKLLGREFINQLAGEEIYPTQKKSRNWFQRLWDFISRVFGSVSIKDKLFKDFYEVVNDPIGPGTVTAAQAREMKDIDVSRKPYEIQEENRKSIIQQNISELRDQSTAQLVEDFDKVFPSMDYLEDWEKEAMIKMIERGEIEISCKIA